eukprot:SAG31_NODE_44868_length_261_cov_0.629630_1_plen_22_part_10
MTSALKVRMRSLEQLLSKILTD